MSDYKSGLPVRSEADGLDERLHVKIVDGTNPAVNQATVDSDQNLHIESHGNDPAGTDRAERLSEQGHTSIDGLYSLSLNTDPSNIGIITAARTASPADSDQTFRLTGATPSLDNQSPTVIHALDVNSFLMGFDGTNWDRLTSTNSALDVNIKTTDIGFNVNVDGIYNVSTNTDPDNIGLIAHNRAASPTDSDQIQRLTAITNSTVHALDVAIRDSSGAAISTSNPLPVSISTDDQGDEIHSYQIDSAVPKDGTANQDYTVSVGKTLKLKQVLLVASGKMKAEIKIETGVGTNTFTTLAVRFNSTATPYTDMNLLVPKIVAAGVRVRVVKTNLDNQAQDLYGTIIGIES